MSMKPQAGFKEKFASLYEDIFALRSPVQREREHGIGGRAALQRFWDELLLLKVNGPFLAQCISREPEERLTGPLKGTINDLFAVCTRYLSDANFIRVAHALETLAVLLREIFKKRFSEQGYRVITLVAGSSDLSDTFFRRFINDIAGLLANPDAPAAIKALCLRLYLAILTATDNISSNPIAAYFFLTNIFEAVAAVLSVKVPEDRRRLELDAALVLLLLLQWRDSPNPYRERLSLSTAPLIPLLNVVHSLFLPEVQPTGRALRTSESDTPAPSSILDYFPSFFAPAPTTSYLSPSRPSKDVRDRQRCRSSAAVFMIYFLLYLNPIMRSLQVWKRPGELSKEQAAGGSLPFLWTSALRAFLSLCWRAFRALPQVVDSGGPVEVPASTSSSLGRWELVSPQPTERPTHAGALAAILRAKTCLMTMRVMVEEPLVVGFLASADSASLPAAPGAGPAAALPASGGSKVIALMLSLTCDVLSLPPAGGQRFDSDLYLRATAVISSIVTRSRGHPDEHTNIDHPGGAASGSVGLGMAWGRLWGVMIQVAEWCSDAYLFNKAGVPHLASQVIAVVEYVLASGADVLGLSEEVERLHATILCHYPAFQKLAQTAEASGLVEGPGGRRRPSFTGDFKLANVRAVHSHYEIQLSAMGIRGVPSERQALEAVHKKGFTGLRFKARPAIAAHAYVEGSAETRVLGGFARALVAEHNRVFLPETPTMDVETMLF